MLLVDSSPTSASRDIARTYLGRLNLKIFDRPDLPMWHDEDEFRGRDRRGGPSMLAASRRPLAARARAERAGVDRGFARNAAAPGAERDRRRSGRRLGVWRCPLPADRAIPSAEVLERLLVQNFIATPAPVFRKDAWLACGGLDEALWYTADWDIWLKLAARGPVLYHDGVTTAFRVHGGSLTMTGSRDIGDFTRQLEIVLDRHLPD